MPRPRKNEQPLAYLNALEVLPAPLVAKVVGVLDMKGLKLNRILTFSQDRSTTGQRLLGQNIYLAVCAVMSARQPGAKSWRLYFPHQLESTDYAGAYADAAKLLRLGFSRRVAALAVGVSQASLKRRVDVAYSETQSDTTVSPEEVNAGYSFIVRTHDDPSVAASTLICGLVGRALKELGRAPS
jgi:hypothetical protein